MARVPEATVRDVAADVRKVALLIMENMIEGEDHDLLWGLDGKRPFGNRDWVGDILEELAPEPDETDGSYSEDQCDYARDVFKQAKSFITESVKARVEQLSK